MTVIRLINCKSSNIDQVREAKNVSGDLVKLFSVGGMSHTA